jgi:D-alanine transaminase
LSAEDLRWRRCNIKSTALLGNVLHFQESYAAQKDETILYNAQDELTEASISNVFIVKDGVVSTPLLDNQILPGISRHIAVESMRHDGSIQVEERIVTHGRGASRQMKFGLPTPANISGQWSN